MQKLHFSITISAPKEKVWDVMLGEETFKMWTEPFMKGSHFVGDWSVGSKMLFLAPDPDKGGKMGGMVSRVKANRPYEFISVEHYGIVEDGKEDTTSDKIKEWTGVESYTFKETDGKTEVLVENDANDKYKEMLEKTWPQALEKLKDLAEK